MTTLITAAKETTMLPDRERKVQASCLTTNCIQEPVLRDGKID